MSAIIEAIRERWSKATMGPWRWFGNTANHDVYLATMHGGRRFIMSFARWGMRGAQPRFQVKQDVGGVMSDVKDLVDYEVPYRKDITGIAHPDAIALEHSWEDVAALLSEVDRLRRISREAALVVRASRRDSSTGRYAPELELLAQAVDEMEAKA